MNRMFMPLGFLYHLVFYSMKHFLGRLNSTWRSSNLSYIFLSKIFDFHSFQLFLHKILSLIWLNILRHQCFLVIIPPQLQLWRIIFMQDSKNETPGPAFNPWRCLQISIRQYRKFLDPANSCRKVLQVDSLRQLLVPLYSYPE